MSLPKDPSLCLNSCYCTVCGVNGSTMEARWIVSLSLHTPVIQAGERDKSKRRQTGLDTTSLATTELLWCLL